MSQARFLWFDWHRLGIVTQNQRLQLWILSIGKNSKWRWSAWLIAHEISGLCPRKAPIVLTMDPLFMRLIVTQAAKTIPVPKASTTVYADSRSNCIRRTKGTNREWAVELETPEPKDFTMESVQVFGSMKKFFGCDVCCLAASFFSKSQRSGKLQSLQTILWKRRKSHYRRTSGWIMKLQEMRME